MMILPAVALASGIAACAVPAIIPWRAGPRDTVFIEIERGTKGCLFADGQQIPGPPYIVCAAFAARPDSAFLGLAINRIVPKGLEARDYDSLLTPERARRFAFVHEAVKSTAYGPHGLEKALSRLTADSRISFARADSSPGAIQSLTIEWKDESVPWSVDFGLPYFVSIPGDPKGRFSLWGTRGLTIMFYTGRSLEFIGPGTTRANARTCSQ